MRNYIEIELRLLELLKVLPPEKRKVADKEIIAEARALLELQDLKESMQSDFILVIYTTLR